MNNIREFISASGERTDLKRGLLFLAAVAVLLLCGHVREYLHAAYKSAFYTHVMLIPFVSAYLLFWQRREVFAEATYAFAPGCATAGVGILCLAAAAAMPADWSKADVHALTAAASVLVTIGAFITVYGTKVFREARFGLFFLVFMIPLPSVVEYWVLRVLQLGSAEFVGLLFPLTGVPVLREGVVFQLPGIGIEVAPECSGIRSSLALVITSALAGHLYLKTGWAKGMLLLAAIPLTMFKNAIRIVTLSLLGVYVNRGFLDSSLHRDGGIVFFVLALMLMAPILYMLRRAEKRSEI